MLEFRKATPEAYCDYLLSIVKPALHKFVIIIQLKHPVVFFVPSVDFQVKSVVVNQENI